MRANRPNTVHPPAQLRNLQVLRALAASSVVIQHAIHDSLSLAGGSSTAPTRYPLNFEFGVDVFFVISGFIMAHTMADAFGRPGASKDFLLRRFARIIPLYWLLTTVMILGSLFAPALLNVPIGDLWHVVASYLFIPDARVTGEIRPVLALGWTLEFEMFFYVLFAIALTLPLRRGVVWLAGAMVSLALVHVIVARAPAPIGYWTNPLILEFLFGIGAALVFRAGTRIGPVAAMVLFAAGLVGFLVIQPAGDEADFLSRFVWTGVPAALLVSAAALGPEFADKRGLAWVVAIGNASYSLYLSHPFIVRPLRAIWTRFIGTRLPVGAYVVFCCACAVLGALIVHKLLERPLTRFIQNLARDQDARASRRAVARVASRPRP